jgi:ABC-type enterochelin transport system substrate-binding protein
MKKLAGLCVLMACFGLVMVGCGKTKTGAKTKAKTKTAEKTKTVKTKTVKKTDGSAQDKGPPAGGGAKAPAAGDGDAKKDPAP